MTTTLRALTILGFVAPIMLTSAITTAGAFTRAEAEHACAHDAMTVCSAFIPDETTTGACLRRNAARITPECRLIVTSGHGGHERRRVRHRRA
jgi:hypothetical protein